jgi:site-specific DNA-methyltransferase (adenine-specific)
MAAEKGVPQGQLSLKDASPAKANSVGIHLRQLALFGGDSSGQKKRLVVRNRITFEREKGRRASKDWKSNSEDIWFCTVSDDYYFDADAVKLKRQVIAPYKEDGKPKDWVEESDGVYRLTAPSNIWTDITIPFWSMPENTPHPTQKPEKLLAKIILASSREGDIVFDPFSGSGTSGAVAKKLGRNFVMIEINEEYCLYAAKRLEMAETDKTIQGYADGVFWERNTAKNARRKRTGAQAS